MVISDTLTLVELMYKYNSLSVSYCVNPKYVHCKIIQQNIWISLQETESYKLIYQ